MAEDQNSVIAAYGNAMTGTPSQIGYEDNYLPSGLFGDVKNMHFGFSCLTTSIMCSTFKLKSGFLGTAV
ncbi:hypothetical protein TSUD_278160 [Trifolium subterraneum]|uniref:Uncharacterized protein n=1 Tax=Trifolium subterraneum TaxID=3900 RepID=A0A2Z6NBL2_TRISU|nr:hypothetical protein TSUD_278160 [Trifolium subterraneum]